MMFKKIEFGKRVYAIMKYTNQEGNCLLLTTLHQKDTVKGLYIVFFNVKRMELMPLGEQIVVG